MNTFLYKYNASACILTYTNVAGVLVHYSCLTHCISCVDESLFSHHESCDLYVVTAVETVTEHQLIFHDFKVESVSDQRLLQSIDNANPNLLVLDNENNRPK